MLEECRQLFNGVVLQSDTSDRWQWDSGSDCGYTVRGVYQQLTTQAEPPDVTVRSWIGMSGVDPLNIDDHFIQFTHSAGHSKARQSFLQLIWLLCVWLVWNERTNRLYNNLQTTIEQLVEKVKFHSFWWLKANKDNFMYGTQRWWSDPLLCLGID